MDMISQLQQEVIPIAPIAFDTFGTLQRDAPPVQLSSSYPESPTNAMEDASSFTEQPQLMSSAFGEAAK